MDPLSLTASIIAVVGLAAQTLKGLHSLYSLRHAPREILELTQEVSELQALLALVQRAINNIVPESLSSEDRALIEGFVYSAREPLESLHRLVASRSRGRDSSPGEGDKKDSRLIVSLAWLKSKRCVNELRQGLLRAHLNVNTALAALNSMHRQEDYRLLLSVHGLVLNQSKAVENWMSLPCPNIMPKSEGNSGSEHIEFRNASDEKLGLTFADSLSSPRSGQSSSRPQLSVSATAVRPRQQLQAAAGNSTCYPDNPCKCHRQKSIESPKWLSEMLGAFFCTYTGAAELQTRRYNDAGCHQQGSASYELTYYFPRWLMSKAVTFAACCRGLGGFSGSWSIGFPRAISASHDVWRCIEQGKHDDVMQMLRGGTVLANDLADDDGTSLLLLALKFRRSSVVNLLLNHGARPHLVDPRGISASAYAQSSCIIDRLTKEPSWSDKMGVSLSGAGVSDDLRFTPLHLVIVGFEDANLSQQIRLNRYNIDATDSLGRSPLHWAVLKGDVSAVETLLGHGACPNATDKERMSPLHDVCQAPQASQAGCARLLLDAGSDIGTRDSWGRTPLRVAVSRASSSLEFITMLIQRGACVNTEDIYGQTPLMKSISANAIVTRLLLEHGAHIEATDVYYNTPLLEAIFRNKSEQLQVLLEYGARTDQLLELEYGRRVRQGDASMLHLAAWYGGIGVLKALEGTVQRFCPYPRPIDDFEQHRRLAPSGGLAGREDERAAFVFLLSTVRYSDCNGVQEKTPIPVREEYLFQSN